MNNIHDTTDTYDPRTSVPLPKSPHLQFPHIVGMHCIGNELFELLPQLSSAS